MWWAGEERRRAVLLFAPSTARSHRSRPALLEGGERFLHILELRVGLHVLVAVAELCLQLVLVRLDLPAERIRLLLLLRAERRLTLLLVVLLGVLCRGSGLCLFLELVHAVDPRHDLIVLVLLAAAHALGLQLGLAGDDVVLQLLKLITLSWADASALSLL